MGIVSRRLSSIFHTYNKINLKVNINAEVLELTGIFGFGLEAPGRTFPKVPLQKSTFWSNFFVIVLRLKLFLHVSYTPGIFKKTGESSD